MSEQGELTPGTGEEAGSERDTTLPENGIINKSECLDEEERLELQKQLDAQNQQRRKSKSGAGKGKLTRSLAVCEESSSRPGTEGLQDQESIQLQLSRFPSLQEDDKSSKDDLEKEKEKDKNKEKDKSSEKAKIRMLSKDCSQEYTDSTGIDLHEFLVNTLKNNPRDRMILLKMEQEIIDFIGDNNNHYKKFPQMSSYQRMLVHRVAAYFGMDHNVDQTGKSVIINKTGNTRMGNRDGSGKTSGSRHSSTENEWKWSDHQRPWSSTDSDSSSRNLKPAITKTASVGGITVLMRGDSSSSNRSSGKLSKTGSESPSSTGSSGSLSRTHQPLQGAPMGPGVPAATTGGGPYPENSLGGQVAPGNTSYILLPLEAAGIPPGSILLNPHTGQPFVNPDGTPAIYNPPSSQQPMRSQMVSQSQQQPLPQSQQQPQPPQQQMANHLLPQPVQAMQPSSQSVQYPAVSYPPQHLLPLSPTQQYPVRDEVTTQFSHMSLSRQSSGDTPEPPAGPVFSSPILQPPAQQPGYVLASTNPQLPPAGFSGSGPPVSQQILQPPSPQGYMQQPASAQMSVYYYPSGQFPTSATQQYRPMTSVQFSTQRTQQLPQATQQPGYQPVLSSQQQGFQGLISMQQPPQTQNLMNNQQGNQVQGMMVQYPTMSSYQVPMTQSSQGLPQQSYQQQILLPNQSGQGTLSTTGMPVFCSVISPASQNNVRLMGPHCPAGSIPVISANCRTNCASMSNPGWQVKY
ncbi:cAMP-regulated phosphoprotein 21 isoform X7 [Tachyglossus aculeatus]|uniref:cAMP-regulated phosphoprotein 21 isoform X7 n=1 Tax=Tachyglossus aculeatus TaxID=9261 RepID=UPI0018F41C91|nr:cAMP-regulated phosphoprotein 21 isoform X7 [Tachyglossus aculeatus]